MVIYRLVVLNGGQRLFSHDLVIDARFPFAEQVSGAVKVFQNNFPLISFLDDDVEMKFEKAPPSDDIIPS